MVIKRRAHLTWGRRGDERHETRGDERRAQRRVRRSRRARVTSRPTDHGARASRRDRPTDHRRRRRRAHGVGGVGIRDGGSEWRRGGRTRWGGRSAHEKRVTSHHAVRRADGGADGGMDRRTEDGQTGESHRRRCRAPPPPPRSRPPKSTLVVPAEEGSGFKEFGSRVGGGWKLSSEKFERTDAKRGGEEARPAAVLHEGVA